VQVMKFCENFRIKVSALSTLLCATECHLISTLV
jgi:hypothetical protein